MEQMAAFAQAFPVNLNCCPHNAGVCMELLAAFAQAFPGYVAKLVSNTILLGSNPRTRHRQPSRLTASSLPVQRVQKMCERAWVDGL